MTICEIWREIPGYGGRYEVSNRGRVRTYSQGRWGNKAPPRIMTLKKTTSGYLQVALYKPGGGGKAHYESVHRLVAKAFLLPVEHKLVVNHKDGNKTNNDADNLEWVTASENSYHAVKTGLSVPSQRQKEVTSLRCSIPVIMLDKELNEIATFRSAKEASEKTGTDHSAIVKCCRGKLKTAKGRKWKYAKGETQ